MVRLSRFDQPGSWHHVMNRGIARRTVFETRDDFRFFLSRLAGAVRRGELEIHAFCVLATHFHLLVRSPVGKLSEGMRRIQNEYVRRFNRTRRRDGPLFRGRFRSRLVDSRVYRHILVRYIDCNSVSAGLVSIPHNYPHSSAHFYVEHAGPNWLERSWIEQVVRETGGTCAYDPKNYAVTFGISLTCGLADLVKRRLVSGQSGPDPLDHLFRAPKQEILVWMRHKARLADGTKPGLIVCDPGSITEAVGRHRIEVGPWFLRPGKKRHDAWNQVHVSLLRDLAGLSYAQVSQKVSCSESGAGKMHRRHLALLLEDDEYGERVQGVVMDAWRLSGLSDLTGFGGE